MLVSLAVDPLIFTSETIGDAHTRDQAELLVRAVLENGILLATRANDFVRDVDVGTSGLRTDLGQQLQILIAELSQNKKRYFAMPASDINLPAGANTDRLSALSIAMRADAVVCSSQDVMERISRGVEATGELIHIRDYSRSSTEKLRRGYLSAVRLDKIEGEERQKHIGRAVRYARRLTLVDRYFSTYTKKGSNLAQLRMYIGGVMYIARQWHSYSPYADGEQLEVEILTVGRDTGARLGRIDSERAKRVIEQEVRRIDSGRIVGKLTVTLKKEGPRRLFLDRFLEAKRRCWGIKHGIYSLAALLESAGRHVEATFIEPASQDYLDLVSELRNLPDAD